jgi:hypothetical protein
MKRLRRERQMDAPSRRSRMAGGGLGGSGRVRPGLAAAVWAVAGLALLANPLALAAQAQWDVLLHGSSLSYLDSQVKDKGYTAGIYGTVGADWTHFVEVGGTITNIEYLSGYTLEQTDLTAAYSRFWARGSARVGGHVVSTTDPLTDGGFVLFGGASAYRVGVWSAGAEASLSNYSSYGADGLRVTQVAPSAGLTLSDESHTRFFSGVLRAYYIGLSEDVSEGTGLEGRSFLSGEVSVFLTSGPVTLSGFAWGGEQAFAVRQGGFLVFNLAELHTGGYGGGLRWVLSPRAALSGGVYIEKFDDMSLEGMEVGGAARVRTLAISLGFTL